MPIVITQLHDTIESLVWRARRAGGDTVAATLALNHGLAESWPLTLPAGVAVVIPDATPATPVVRTITLWS